MSSSLDITGKIDAATIELFRTISQIIESLDISYVVVGATARDLVLHHAHGVELERATKDVDFAIEVPNWEAFEALRNKLAEEGFKTTRRQHRLVSPEKVEVDIVPFGKVEDDTASISWPPDGEVVMNVLGFQEASDNADRVRIADEPDLIVPVVTPAGMALLKLIAWTDRDPDMRAKDAQDLAYLLRTYERIPAIQGELYGEEWSDIMNSYDWDITQASAHKLGHDAAAIAAEMTRLEIGRLMQGENKVRTPEHLVTEMCGRSVEVQYEMNDRLLTAFCAGFGIERQ